MALVVKQPRHPHIYLPTSPLCKVGWRKGKRMDQRCQWRCSCGGIQRTFLEFNQERDRGALYWPEPDAWTRGRGI